MPPPIARAARMLAFVCAVAACGGDGDGAQPARSASSAAPAPVPARPGDLAAHVVVAAPRTTLPALRSGFPDAAAALPGSFASIVTTVADLPITVAELVEDDAPITATVLASKAAVDVVVAIHVRSVDRLVSLATAGDSARYRAAAGEAGLVRLVAARPRDGAPKIAALGNHLLIATSDAAIDRAGAFTERAPPPALGDGELVAIEHGAAMPLLAKRLATREKPPLPPGPHGSFFPDPTPLIAEKLGPVFDALAGGRTSMRVDDGRLRIDVAAGDSIAVRLAAAALPTSDASSWLALPRDASIALLFHAGGAGSDPVVPSDDVAATIGITGARREAVTKAMAALDGARGPAVAIGAGVAPAGPALWFRSDVADRERASSALHDLVKAVGEKSREERPSVTAKETVVERVGDVVRLRVRVAGPEDARPVDVYLRRDEGHLVGATGTEAVEALQALNGGPPASRVGAEPIAAAIAASASKHHVLALVDLGGGSLVSTLLGGVAGGKSRPSARVFAVASLADRDGALSLRVLAEPAAVSALREKLLAP